MAKSEYTDFNIILNKFYNRIEKDEDLLINRQVQNPVMLTWIIPVYNGEKYLSEQIDSILNQTYKDWHLLIRDDGSVDETISIISKYVSKYPNKITWINKEDVRNVGVIRSFEALMKESTSPCFMFCDQDDVWLPHKISVTLEKMKDTILKLPCLPDGTPDFAYMEAYIKSLQYSDRI